MTKVTILLRQSSSHALQITACPESWILMDLFMPADYGNQFFLRIRQTPHFSASIDMIILGVSQQMANESVEWGLPAALSGQRVWEAKNR